VYGDWLYILLSYPWYPLGMYPFIDPYISLPREAEPGRVGSEGIKPPPRGYLSFFIKVFVFRRGLEQK
jgi:hypothetical protein